MLWYKAWLETRSRFLLSLLGMVVLCSYIIYHGNKEAMPYTKLNYYNFVIHSGHTMLCMMWALAITLLTMGGLLREKAVGTAAFTLSLPVSRAWLMGVRIAVGLLEAMALAVVPWCAMFVTTVTTGKALPQAGFYLALLLGGGVVFFGMGLLVSSLVEGEYTAPVVSFGIMLAMTIVMTDGALRAMSPLGFMNGVDYYDRHTGLLTGGIPWQHIALSAGFAAVLVVTSVAAMRRREF